jgi:hypothetical protein
VSYAFGGASAASPQRFCAIFDDVELGDGRAIGDGDRGLERWIYRDGDLHLRRFTGTGVSADVLVESGASDINERPTATSTLTVKTTAATAVLARPDLGRSLVPIYAITFPMFGLALLGRASIPWRIGRERRNSFA